ncbi:hypothetical protein FisN_38Lu038 [Fistulifera solaris]|uniref:Integrase catalytic domain-containing protein n=1 Tax=Fistulifera solaris TaxID=1519565 RepID=A0A1Z5J6K6_FISSO|nr:hypothetical protein FisN_38Lu038 [Fistulifera solaris]|eukprot:GAX09610.1 hypothetical protein FisN_38Lu038 [Fistulifera solaris]
MESYGRLMEIAIERIAAGHGPPNDAIPVPEGEVIPHEPTNYRIPDNFPNPPPGSPLNGIQGARFVLVQCGMTNAQITSLMGNDIVCLEDLAEIKEDDIDEHLKILSRASQNRGGMVLGLGVVPKVKALVSLLHELTRSGDGILDAYKVSMPYLREWQKESKAVVIGDDKVDVTLPEKFDHKDWVSFKDGLENYFRQTKGTRKIPLFYVIRGETHPEGVLSFTEARMWNARHNGPEYDADNARVYQQLVQVFRNTDGWAYVASTTTQDGRQVWKRLCYHYDGPHAIEKRIAMARAEIKKTEYKNEASYPLERYVTKLTDCFRILEQNKAPMMERDKLVGQVKIEPDIIEEDIAFLRHDEPEFDRLLNNCSSVYSEKVLTQRLIASVKIASEYDTLPRAEERISEESIDAKMCAIGSGERHSRATPEEISKKFGCGLETARKTLKATTNFGVRTATGPLIRRYRTDIMQTTHRRIRATVFNDTMFSKTKSLRGNKCAEVFTDGKFVTVKPTPNKTGETVANALREFIQEVGIPQKIVVDDAKEKLGMNTKWMEHIRHYKMDWANSEPYSHWQNQAEGAIREVRRRWKLLQHRRMIPKRLWDYGLTHVAEVMSRTVRSGSDRTPYEIMTGETPDISEYIDFEFYDWVWYLNNPNDKESPPELGRWLGVSYRVGAAMCYFVLTQKGVVLSRSSVQPFNLQEQLSNEVRLRMEKFDTEINGRLDDKNYISNDITTGILYLEDDDPIVEGEEESPIREADDVWDINAYDQYINAEILLPVGDGRIAGTVIERKRDSDGKPIGVRHLMPMMDTRLYNVKLADGTIRELFANNIAECMFSEVDSEGRSYRLLKEISDHRKLDSAIDKEHGIYRYNNRDYHKMTTKGWLLLVEWMEGHADWVPLKDLKEAYPVQVAEYAKANGIDDEPAFAWWVKDVLRQRNSVIAKVKSRYWKTTHKFGIRIPKTVKEALQIDKETGTDY